MITPSFLEDHISQVPALQLLVKLGYTYLSPEEALAQRQGKAGQVLNKETEATQYQLEPFSIKKHGLMQHLLTGAVWEKGGSWPKNEVIG